MFIIVFSYLPVWKKMVSKDDSRQTGNAEVNIDPGAMAIEKCKNWG